MIFFEYLYREPPTKFIRTPMKRRKILIYEIHSCVATEKIFRTDFFFLAYLLIETDKEININNNINSGNQHIFFQYSPTTLSAFCTQYLHPTFVKLCPNTYLKISGVSKNQ